MQFSQPVLDISGFSFRFVIAISRKHNSLFSSRLKCKRDIQIYIAKISWRLLHFCKQYNGFCFWVRCWKLNLAVFWIPLFITKSTKHSFQIKSSSNRDRDTVIYIELIKSINLPTHKNAIFSISIRGRMMWVSFSIPHHQI